MSWQPAQRLRARLLRGDPILALLATIGTITWATWVNTHHSFHDAGARLSTFFFVGIALMAVYDTVRSDPRKLFLPYIPRMRHIERNVAYATLTIGVVALATVGLVMSVGRSMWLLIPFGFILIALMVLALIYPLIMRPAPISGRLLRRPVGMLAGRVAWELAPQATPLQRWQRRLRPIYLPFALAAQAAALALSGDRPALESAGAVVAGAAMILGALAFVISELIAIAIGESPEPEWGATTWFDEHFSQPERYAALTHATTRTRAFSVRVAAGRLWLTARGRWQSLPLWPGAGYAIADGAVEARVEPQLDGLTGVVARWRAGAGEGASCYVGWLGPDGSAGIALARDGALDLAAGQPGALVTLPVGSVKVTSIVALRLMAIGAELRFAVNDREVARVEDSELRAGRWGVFCGALADAPASAAFDSVSVIGVARVARNPTRQPAAAPAT